MPRRAERLHAHLDEAVEDAGRRLGVDGGEDEVSAQASLDRDARGLGVADLADHHHVGILAQHRAQTLGEGEAGVRAHLGLGEGRDVELDGIFNRRNLGGLSPLFLDVAERAVDGRGLAAAGGAGDEDEPLGAAEQAEVLGLQARREAQRAEASGTRTPLSAMRSTTFSPWLVGSSETRTSVGPLGLSSVTWPSWGRSER